MLEYVFLSDGYACVHMVIVHVHAIISYNAFYCVFILCDCTSLVEGSMIGVLSTCLKLDPLVVQLFKERVFIAHVRPQAIQIVYHALPIPYLVCILISMYISVT